MHNQINDEAVSLREAAIERELIWLAVMRLMKPNLEYSRRMNRLMAEAYELTKNPKYLL
jgi:hypothetical protein